MNTRVVKHIIVIGCVLLMSGCTTLHTAASKGNVKAIDRLVKEEANLDETDSAGKTPLMYAVMFNQKESLSALLKAGADVNTQSDIGNTALHEAVLQGNIKFASLLLEKGSDRSLRNKEGKTALDLANETGNQNLITLVAGEYQDVKDSPKAVQLPVIPMTFNKIDVIEPIPVIEPTAPINVPTEPKVVPQPSSATPAVVISKEEASLRLRKMIAGRETMGIRNFLNEFPYAIEYIEEPMQRIRYVGPSGWRIIDIIENMGRGRYKESDVVHHIMTAQLPYKQFTPDEFKMLSRYGLSPSIIDAMVKVTK